MKDLGGGANGQKDGHNTQQSVRDGNTREIGDNNATNRGQRDAATTSDDQRRPAMTSDDDDDGGDDGSSQHTKESRMRRRQRRRRIKTEQNKL